MSVSELNFMRVVVVVALEQQHKRSLQVHIPPVSCLLLPSLRRLLRLTFSIFKHKTNTAKLSECSLTLNLMTVDDTCSDG